MPDAFPHLDDTPFPGVSNIDVYEYRNDFDYARYSADVEVELLQVPWDSSYQSVVDFGSDSARDTWFDSLTVRKVEINQCMCKVPTESLNVPLPYNEAVRYNYVRVKRTMLTSVDDPVAYETKDAISWFFYFIIDAEPLATSTTQLTLAIDWFTTYWYRLEHPFCMLERGHFPMAQVTPQQFLNAPLSTNKWLMSPDINYGQTQQIASYNDFVMNDVNCWALIACSTQPNGTWLDSGGAQRTPSSATYNVGGVPAYNVFATAPNHLQTLMSQIANNRPQMLQTVKGIYFVSSELLTLGTTFDIEEVECWTVSAQTKNVTMMNLEVNDFNLPVPYRNITKLYTFPYSVIEITDGRGNTRQIRVEDTNGTVAAQLALSIALPYLGIDVAITSVGAMNSRSVLFKNLTQRSRTLAGDWYKTMLHYDIPVYGIFENAYNYDTFAHQWERDTATYAADNAYNSAVESANTSVTNTANTGTTQTNNMATMTALNTGIVNRNNAASTEITAIGNATSQAAQAYDAGLQRNVQEADAEAVAATTLTNAIGNLASSVLSGAVSGGIAGAAMGAAQSVIGGVTAGVNAAVMLNASATKVELSITNSQNKVTSQNNSNTSITEQSTDTQSTNVTQSNTAQTTINNRNVSVANTNATNSANTAKNNAQRSKNSTTRGITNGRKANYVKPPLEFGQRTGSSLDVDTPQIMSTCILTQLEGELALAGDAMLRWGYMYNGQVDATNLNVCDKFSYWQGDMVITPGAVGANGGTIDALRRIFKDGTTVYSNPNYIGVSIYDNGF